MSPHEIFEALLATRGITDRASFLDPRYELHTHDPFLLPGMQAAVERIVKARERGEPVAIYGDYDIDGLTASTLLKEALTAMGLEVTVYIPNRFTEGYGMGEAGIEAIRDRGATLIITVDCGSRSVDEIAYAKKLGIDVIVTDHHHVGEIRPKCVALINPKAPESEYPFRDLAGCGVAFKLVQALQTRLDGLPKGQEKWLLDLVALGTVCDVVDLVDENRVFVKWGLAVMRRTRRPGLKALAMVSRTPLNAVDPSALGFRFGPRLNAAGRLETAIKSLELLSAANMPEATALAWELDDLNARRRTDQDRILTEALVAAQQFEDDPLLVLADAGWSHGIVGIVASKLVEKLKKPVFLMQVLNDVTKGSARSFGDFHLAEALDAVRPLLLSGGGHAAAAGCSIRTVDLSLFRQVLNEHYRTLKLADQLERLLTGRDLELEDFGGLDEQLLELLQQLEPFGQGNRQPLFAVKGVTIENWKAVGQSGQHAKMTVRDVKGVRREGIGFDLVEALKAVSTPLEVAFYLEWNEWQGRRSLQHRIVDVKPA